MRKKFFYAVTTVMIFLFCAACNKSGGILARSPDLSKPFQSSIKLQAGELELNGAVKRYGMGIWEMTVNSPETLAGLSLSGNDGGVTASLGELKLELPMENVSDKAVFSLMFKAIDSAASSFEAGVLTCTDTADGKVCSGEFAGGTYTLTFDPQSLALTKIEIPAAEICGEFTAFEVLSGGTVTEPADETSAN